MNNVQSILHIEHGNYEIIMPREVLFVEHKVLMNRNKKNFNRQNRLVGNGSYSARGSGNLGIMDKGFSLIEILIVLVIAVIIMGVVGPKISSGISSVKFKSITKEVVSGLRYARMKSITENRKIEFIVNLEQHFYRIDDENKNHPIPEDIEITLVTASTQVIGEEQGAIIYFPDGSSSGGRVTLETEQQKHLIDVNWLTGMVEVSEEDPEE
jgi:general secretion pathway protein H